MEEATHTQDLTTRPSGFVLSKADELAPSRVTDGFGQAVVFDHAGDIQRFKGEDAVAVNQLPTQLVLIVFALVANALLQPGNWQACGVALLGTLLLTTQVALTYCQAALAALQVFGL